MTEAELAELRSHLEGRAVMHYIDNTSALAGLVRGYSPQPDSSRIVHALWALVLGLGSLVWFMFVRSEANVADFPSRGSLDFMKRLHELVPGSAPAVHVDFVLPVFDEWPSIDQAMAVGRSAFSAVLASASGRLPGRSRRGGRS